MSRLQNSVLAVCVAISLSFSASGACVSSVTQVRGTLAEPVLTPGPVAWSGNVLGSVWTDSVGAIWFALHTVNGFEIQAPRLLLPEALKGPLALVASDSEFALFYRSGAGLMMARLARSGTLLATPRAVPTLTSPRLSDDLDALWSPRTLSWVLLRRGSGNASAAYASIIDADGDVVRGEEMLDSTMLGSPIALAETTSGFGAFFVGRPGDLRVSSFDEANVATLITVADTVDRFAVAGSPDGFMIVETKKLLDGMSEMHLIRIDAAGKQLNSQLIHAVDGDLTAPSLLNRGDEMAISYQRRDAAAPSTAIEYRLRRVDVSGALLADTPFAAASPLWNRASSPHRFSWTGDAYVQLVANRNQETPPAHIATLCPLAVEVEAAPVARMGNPVQFTSLVDGGVPPFSYAWKFGDRRVAYSAAPQNTYTSVGTFTVTLTVTDASGVAVTSERTMRVVEGKQRAVAH